MFLFFPNLPPSSQLLLEDSSPFSLCLVVSKSSFLYGLHSCMCRTWGCWGPAILCCFIKDLCISGFWYLLGALEPILQGTKGEQPLLRYLCLLEACPGWVSAQLCVPTCANFPLWGLPSSCLCVVPGLWAPWGWGPCFHHCWPTA